MSHNITRLSNRVGSCTFLERHRRYYSLDQRRRSLLVLLLYVFFSFFPLTKSSSAMVFFCISYSLEFVCFFWFRSNDLASCSYLLHLGCPRRLCVMVSSSLPCLQVLTSYTYLLKKRNCVLMEEKCSQYIFCFPYSLIQCVYFVLDSCRNDSALSFGWFFLFYMVSPS